MRPIIETLMWAFMEAGRSAGGHLAQVGIGPEPLAVFQNPKPSLPEKNSLAGCRENIPTPEFVCQLYRSSETLRDIGTRTTEYNFLYFTFSQ